MRVKASSIIGLKVVSLAKGEEIDEIGDLIYDSEAKNLVAVLVDHKFFPEANIIPYPEIKGLGKDAVTIESSLAIKKASELGRLPLESMKTNSSLKKMNVLTEGGTNLGRIAEVIFESQTGRVEEFEVSRGPVEDIRSGRKHLRLDKVLTVGVDNIIVTNQTEAEFKGQKGGLK